MSDENMPQESPSLSAEARRQESFLESVFESVTHPFYVIDAVDYTVKMANSAAVGSDGWARHVTCYALTHRGSAPCEDGEHPCPLAEVRETKQPVTVEHIHYDNRGRVRYVEVHGYPIFDDEGNVVQMIEYAVDITKRKQAEEALRRSEERYALAQRVANVGSWDWDIRTGHLYWSDQIEPMFGFARGEFEATYENFLQRVHPQDRKYVVDSVDACVSAGTDYNIEHRIVWPDGTIRWVSEIGDVIRDEEGRAIRMLGIVQDITERKRAEEEIRWLAGFPSENPNPVLRIARDCTILYANEASSTLLDDWGTQVGECLSDEWQELVLGVLTSESSREVEVEVEGRIISLTFAPVTGADYVNVYGLDITGRRRAEERLYLQGAALEAAANGIVITDDEGTIIWANPAFTRLTGYAVEEVIGQNTRLLKSGQQEDAFYRDMWCTICAGQVWYGELVNRRKDGSLYTEEMTITPVRGEDG
jgi:PAS domain S-box-containing protein